MLGLINYYKEDIRDFIAVENSLKDVTCWANAQQEQEVYTFLNILLGEGWEMAQATDMDGFLFWVCDDGDNNRFTVFTKIPADVSEI